MIKLTNILLEGTNIYEVKFLLKSEIKFNRIDLCNQIRALPGVVTLEIIKNDFLDSKRTDIIEFTLIRVKFLTRIKVDDAMNKLKLGINHLEGIKQVLLKTNTLIKKSEL